MTHPTITKEQALQLAREAGFKQRYSIPNEWWMLTDDIERFAKSIYKLGRNAGLEEARKATVPHSCVMSAARAIESLKDNTP